MTADTPPSAAELLECSRRQITLRELRGAHPVERVDPRRVAAPAGDRTPRAALAALTECPGWRLVLDGPPRTKKNHTTLGIVQSAAYREYERRVVAQLAPILASAAGFPIPRPTPLRLDATFYVDRYGKTADAFGLLQALADALEAAGVYENDHQIRRIGRVEIVADDPHPRTVLTLTHLL